MRIAKVALFAGAVALASTTGAHAQDCGFENDVPVSSLSAGFEAWKVVTDAMATCGNFSPELDQEFRTKQPEGMAQNPSLFTIGGVANGTLVPLLDGDLVRPLNDLVDKYGQDLDPSQLITVDGNIMAIAMMVNAQHLMYRADILADLGLDVPTTYGEVLAAAEAIQQAAVVDFPLGGTYQTGWNLGEEFINMHLGMGGQFFKDGNQPAVNSPEGVAALEMMKALTAYMDPEYLVSDSTFVQQQFQQGKIAMANLWASRAAAMDNAEESEVVGLVEFAAAPIAREGGAPATTLWWDGMTIAKNVSDEAADAAFRLMMHGISDDVLAANAEAAIWLTDAFEPTRIASGTTASVAGGAPAYPASAAMGMMHTALGNNIADFLTGAESAEQSLADVETEYLAAATEAGLL